MENAEPRVDVEKKPLSRYENIASVSGREERVKASIELSKPLSPCVGDVSEVRPDVIESLPWGTPTKPAVQRFAEELELVLRAKERVETERDRALALKRDATLALEQQRTRALQSDNALRFARNEIARLTKKSNEATIVNASLRKESAGRREKLKKAEKRLAEAEHKEEELRREVAILRKDLQVQRQALKAKHAETARLENVLRDTLNGKLTEQAGDNGNVKRIEELEEKLTRLKVSISRGHPSVRRSNERELELIVQELAKEELKSRARADVAERVAAELRMQLDAKTAEVVTLRRHLDALDHVTLPTVPIPPESKTPLEPVEQSLFERRSNVKSGYTMATPTSVHSGHPEDRIRELEVALDEQLTRCDTAEKLAAKATGEVCGLREALQLTTERIASAAAQVAESKGLTGAYVATGNASPPSYATPTLNQGASPFSARSSRSATSASAQLEISRELQEVKRQTMFERLAREEAEESIRRWSQLQE